MLGDTVQEKGTRRETQAIKEWERESREGEGEREKEEKEMRRREGKAWQRKGVKQRRAGKHGRSRGTCAERWDEEWKTGNKLGNRG